MHSYITWLGRFEILSLRSWTSRPHHAIGDSPLSDLSADDLPPYTRRNTLAQPVVRREPTEHVYLLNEKNRPWVTLKLYSSAKSSKSLPTFFEKENINGILEINADRGDSIQSITATITGRIITGANAGDSFTFLSHSLPIWSKSLDVPRLPSPSEGASKSKLLGRCEWTLSIPLPRTVTVLNGTGSPETCHLPETFLERHTIASIQYDFTIQISRGMLRVDSQVKTAFGYVPSTRPELPSLLRQLAYQQGTSLAGPHSDPDGWKSLRVVTARGLMDRNRQVEVQCVVSLAKPLSYTRGTVLPCFLTLQGSDEAILDLFSAPSAISVKLHRRIRFFSKRSQSDDAWNENVKEVGSATWWPSAGVRYHSSVRHMEGEIRLAKDLRPSTVVGHFSIYTRSLLSEPVEIATMHAKGPRPQAYSPPAYAPSTRSNDYYVPPTSWAMSCFSNYPMANWVTHRRARVPDTSDRKFCPTANAEDSCFDLQLLYQSTKYRPVRVMASGVVNIRRDVDDKFYRYRMPILNTKIEGKGNGIKTVVPNMSDVARALSRPPTYTTKFFGCELGAQTSFDEKNDRYIVNGAHNAERLRELLDVFIDKFVLCRSCKNPETELVILKSGRNENIIRDCKACGERTEVDMRHKLTTFILKNPPVKVKKGKNRNTGDAAGGVGGGSDMNGDSIEQEANGAESDDELTKKIKAEAAELNNDAVLVNEDWSADTSPEAVKQRIKTLEGGMASVVLGGDEEGSDEDANSPYAQLGRWIDDNRDDQDDPKAFSVAIYKKAEELAIERKHKALLVLVQALFTDAIISEIPKYGPLLIKGRHQRIHLSTVNMVTSEKHQKSLLGGIERFVGLAHPDLIPAVPKILMELYQIDVLDEEVVTQWGTHVSKKYVDREISKKVRKSSEPFLKWLEEADDDDEDDEEEG
ncbi:hypothetical protein D9615_010121 [Tricholomella constricta]|uniref:W2 domain-containing protein n=1 Tax=Tricholomella constricta TaxID=117010 RepID=A0A8H5LWL6_9AGAR|nr:hypothetical protein D9615_010121 [Tricholomella constricta]